MADSISCYKTGTLTSSPGCRIGSPCCFSTSLSATCSTAPLASRPSSPSSSTGSSSEYVGGFQNINCATIIFSVDLVPSAPSQLDWGIWSPMLTFSQWQVFHKFPWLRQLPDMGLTWMWFEQQFATSGSRSSDDLFGIYLQHWRHLFESNEHTQGANKNT